MQSPRASRPSAYRAPRRSPWNSNRQRPRSRSSRQRRSTSFAAIHTRSIAAVRDGACCARASCGALASCGRSSGPGSLVSGHRAYRQHLARRAKETHKDDRCFHVVVPRRCIPAAGASQSSHHCQHYFQHWGAIATSEWTPATALRPQDPLRPSPSWTGFPRPAPAWPWRRSWRCRAWTGSR